MAEKLQGKCHRWRFMLLKQLVTFGQNVRLKCSVCSSDLLRILSSKLARKTNGLQNREAVAFFSENSVIHRLAVLSQYAPVTDDDIRPINDTLWD